MKKVYFPQTKKAQSLRLCQNPVSVRVPDAELSAPVLVAQAYSDIVAGKGRKGPAAENFMAIYLNAANQMVNYYRIEGTVDHAAVYLREIVVQALGCNAVSACMVHNHPSGNLQFSQQDIDMARKLKTALKTVDIRLHDSIVVAFKDGGMDYNSAAERGLMPS